MSVIHVHVSHACCSIGPRINPLRTWQYVAQAVNMLFTIHKMTYMFLIKFDSLGNQFDRAKDKSVKDLAVRMQ